MKIVFMGTPDFAVPSLEALHASGRHRVSLVVTQPDRPKGRGQKPAMPAVKEKALELGLPVIQPDKLRTPEFHARIAEEGADILVVVAYRILPESLFPLARHGAVNVHGSLLPKYRGAAPIQWAIAKGERSTGVTVFQLDAQVDHGRILGRAETPIGPDETAGDLFGRLQLLGRDLLLRTLDDLEAGRARPQPQDDALATPAPKLRKEDGLLDWTLPARVLHDRVRAFNPYPICYTRWGDPERVLRVHRSEPSDTAGVHPGAVLVSSDRFPLVGCGEGLLRLVEVQPEGRPRMSGRDFLNGLKGEALGFR